MTEYRALPAPSGDLFVLSDEALQTTVRASHGSPRRRMIQPFHRSEQDTLHRMFNAVQPDSYVRPHRHLDPPKAERGLCCGGRSCSSPSKKTVPFATVSNCELLDLPSGWIWYPGCSTRFLRLSPTLWCTRSRPARTWRAT